MENYEEIRLPWTEWKIVKFLGSGTYGKVYEIERNISGMQEKAALKIISRPKDAGEVETYYDEGYDKAVIIASYENEIRNYLQEYKVMKELQGQSNIVSCEDFKVVPHEDGIGGDIFLRMELLTPLRQILREKTLSEEEIIKLGKDISRALILCECENIIHRDIKPANIMVSRFGDYKLGDFGVSKVMDHATYATAMGTPEYQAPEVVHMEKYDHRADIYSLGITLYWLLNNRRMPFVGADEKLTPMIKEQAIDQRYQGKKLPAPKNGSEELKKIVLKACAYSPKDRYASAQEMYEELEGLGKSPSVRNIQDNGEKDPDTAGEEFLTEESPTDREIAEYTEYQEEETAGNSWGGTDGTIGKPEENIQQEQKKEEYKEEEEKTIGLETADEKQQKKDAEKKEEETVIAPVPVKKKKMPRLIFIIIVSVGVYVISFFLGFTNHKSEYDEAGNEVKRTYYGLDRKIKSCYEYDEAGNEVKSTQYDENGNIDHYYESEYDEAGNKVKSTQYDENGNIELCQEYDEAGNEVKSTQYDENGNIELCQEYDEAGNEVKRTYYDENGNIDDYYESEYDEAGNEVKRTYYDENGNIDDYYEYEYDEAGNEVKNTWYEYDENGNIDSYSCYEYDEAGNEVKRMWYAYDENGNVKYYSESEYDEAGNEVKSTHYDENGNIWFSYEYDEAGNEVKRTYYDENGNIDSYSEYEYDEAGNMVIITSYYENGVMNRYEETEYNADKRRVKRTLYDSDGVCTGYIVYEHDSEGNEIGGTCYNADGSINNSYKWDNSDGPIVETVPEELTE